MWTRSEELDRGQYTIIEHKKERAVPIVRVPVYKANVDQCYILTITHLQTNTRCGIIHNSLHGKHSMCAVSN